MIMLIPHITEELNKYYHPKILNDFYPQVTPQNIDVVEQKEITPLAMYFQPLNSPFYEEKRYPYYFRKHPIFE